MSYKLVAVDMDGTLLNSKDIITKRTQDSIKKLVNKGIVFTICTGRPIQGIEQYNKLLKLDAPFITYNGAMIVKSISKDVLFKQNLTINDAKKIYQLGQEFKTTIIVWSNNKLYVNKINDLTQKYKKLSTVEPIIVKDIETIVSDGITKILWYDEVEKIKKFESKLFKEISDGVNFCTSKPIFLEFFDKRVSKGVALKKIGEFLNIRKEETIAIGDGFNDLPMLEYAGLSVAMKNAPNEIKEKCNFITKSNDDEGVANFIEKHL